MRTEPNTAPILDESEVHAVECAIDALRDLLQGSKDGEIGICRVSITAALDFLKRVESLA